MLRHQMFSKIIVMRKFSVQGLRFAVSDAFLFRILFKMLHICVYSLNHYRIKVSNFNWVVCGAVRQC